jgi:demethylspheroidene O-methyltransferase
VTKIDLAGIIPASLSDRWFALRDRLLGNPGFHRWAAAFPLTRPVARHQTRALFDLCAGFVYSQVLLACVRLHLFDALRAGPLTPDELSPRLGLSADATGRLLAAAASLRLVQPRGQNRFGLGMLGAALTSQPGIAAMIEHHALLYGDLADPVALLRGDAGATGIGRYWPYARRAGREVRPDQAAAYSELMSVSQSLIAHEVLDAFPLGRHRCLLDVGGGEGAFLAAAARRAPQLRLHLFELPPVAARAEEVLAAQGLAERTAVTAGNFHSDPIPDGADVISLIRVLHDHDDEPALALLRAVHRALPSGGTLLLAEPMARTPGAEPIGAAYFGFYLLAMGSGRPRSLQEITRLLRTAGFARVAPLPTRTPLLVRVVTAETDRGR